MSPNRKAHSLRSRDMGSKWKGAADQRFSEEWPLSLRNCSISSKCVLFSSLKKNAHRVFNVLSQRMPTLARRTSSRHSSCVASSAICTSPIRHPITCTSSPPLATPQTALLSPRVMYTSPLPSANSHPHSTRLSRTPHGRGLAGRANGKPYSARLNDWKRPGRKERNVAWRLGWIMSR